MFFSPGRKPAQGFPRSLPQPVMPAATGKRSWEDRAWGPGEAGPLLCPLTDQPAGGRARAPPGFTVTFLLPRETKGISELLSAVCPDPLVLRTGTVLISHSLFEDLFWHRLLVFDTSCSLLVVSSGPETATRAGEARPGAGGRRSVPGGLCSCSDRTCAPELLPAARRSRWDLSPSSERRG